MKNKLIKPIVKVGNSAGVVLPKEWYGGKARVELIEKPLNITKDVFEILEPYLDRIMGIYLVGSYARKEQNENSDIDILVITQNIDKILRKGKYDIIMISEKELEKGMKIIVPIIPMLYEARALLNKKFLEELRNIKIKKENLKWHLETTKTALKIIKDILDLGEEKINGEIVYSLILRLREVYIVNQILRNKEPTKKGFLEILKKNKILPLYSSYELKKRGKKTKSEKREFVEVAYHLINKMLK